MISITLVLEQQAASAPAAPPSAAARAEMAENIRQTIQAAQEAAQDAANRARIEAGPQHVTLGPNGIIVRPDAPGEPTVYVGSRAMDHMIPPQAVDISIAFFIMMAVMVVGWPIARAFGRRIERKGQVATLDAGTMEQLQRIEQAVDAMSIEVERISESQRFMARLQRDASQALPSVESR